MTEVWLRTNRRALAACLVAAVLLVMIGVLLARGGRNNGTCWYAGISCGIAGGLSAAVVVRFLMRPLVAYRHGHVLIYVRFGRPIVLPIDMVECFFLGEADATLPGRRPGSTRVTTVVVRLSESASDWQRQAVNPLLGHWQDGYLILRGTWCEPLDFDFVNRLNARLRQQQTSVRQARVDSREKQPGYSE